MITRFASPSFLKTFFCTFFFIASFSCFSFAEISPAKRKALYSAIHPSSLSQLLAFFQLYPDSEEGKKSEKHIWKLLVKSHSEIMEPKIRDLLQDYDLSRFFSFLNTQELDFTHRFNNQELHLIETLSKDFPNKALLGHQANSEEDVLALAPNYIDLSRGLLLSLGDDKVSPELQRQYEASLDLMALYILAKLPEKPSPEAVIRAINEFIFMEMHFRFPPESQYSEAIDFYTFLPSVLQSRKGVCLGVSTLYFCLAQRLGLTLEIITPPGHIYLRYSNGKRLINIETTARGINPPSKKYLGINTLSLQQRNIKELIGLSFFNLASTYWQQGEAQAAIEAYKKTLLYMPENPLIYELMAYNYLALGDEKEGKRCLEHMYHLTPKYLVSGNTVPEDYLNGNIDSKGIQIIYQHVDETQASIIAKQKSIQDILKEYSFFREGYFHLAITWMQLHRYGEALEALKAYHEIDTGNPTVEYYLTALYTERYNYTEAWRHLENLRNLLKAHEHHPEAFDNLELKLSSLSPY